jgi:putative DNA primase/helicase
VSVSVRYFLSYGGVREGCSTKREHADVVPRQRSPGMSVAAEGLARALGGHRVGDHWMARCPAHADTTPSLAISMSPEGKVLLYCHAGCAQLNVLASLRDANLWPASSPLTLGLAASTASTGKIGNQRGRSQSAMTIWQRTTSAAESLAVKNYLKSRAIRLPPPDRVRFAPSLKHRDGLYFPTIVSLVTSGLDDRPIGIQRTFLAADGLEKAPVDSPRLSLGPCSGGAVRLAPLGNGPLMVGEGIETCLAAMQATGQPAWAALSTSGLRSLSLPPDVRDVVVLVDGDEPGRHAANAAAEKWTREGRQVRLAEAPSGLDFNDLLMDTRDDAGDTQ